MGCRFLYNALTITTLRQLLSQNKQRKQHSFCCDSDPSWSPVQISCQAIFFIIYPIAITNYFTEFQGEISWSILKKLLNSATFDENGNNLELTGKILILFSCYCCIQAPVSFYLNLSCLSLFIPNRDITVTTRYTCNL